MFLAAIGATGPPQLSDAANCQCEVVTTEPEGVVQGRDVALRELAVFTINDVESDRRVVVIKVDRGRGQTLVDGQDGEDRLKRSGGTEQVAGHRLGRAHRHVVDLVAEGEPNGVGFGDVAYRG